MAHIAPDFTCVNCAAVGTIFETTDLYELVFKKILLVSLHNTEVGENCARNKRVLQNRKTN